MSTFRVTAGANYTDPSGNVWSQDAVNISPSTATVAVNQTQQFTATVSGTTNTAVTWTTTGGTVSASGLYTAPVSAGTYTVTATSVADPTKTALATVIVSAPVAVSISPLSASLLAGATQQFTAAVSGSSNTSVTWTATGGTVLSSGLYTAGNTPGTFSVTAISQADTTKSASATVVVNSPPLGIKLVQHTSKDAGTTTSSTLSFGSNVTAGNWIAVLVRSGISNQTITVTDSLGNAYRQAVKFNVTLDAPNGHTLGIFYAENIKAGANAVTVTNSVSATLRFAILEYSGVALANSLDGTSAAQGGSNAPNSGNVTTTASGDLLLAAISTANSATYTAGSGYVIEERVPIAAAKLIAEDRTQAQAGSAAATASLGASDAWGDVLAAFKAAAAPRRR